MRNGRFPSPGHAGEYKRTAIANAAGGVKQKSALPRQNQRVYDAQDRIHRIGIVRLAHAAAAHPRVPLRDEIIAAEAPFAVFDAYLNIILRIRVLAADLIGDGDYVHIELDLGIRRVPEETRVV